MTILVTGGAGFIGSTFVRHWRAGRDEPIVNLDKLTYAGNAENLADLADDSGHAFVHGDIADTDLVSRVLTHHRPRAVIHFAAESHVDRSILGAAAFIDTNINGTFRLLEAVRGYWEGLEAGAGETFRFLQISTDEVYGTLAPDDPAFGETSPYAPNSPYAASKAAADHLARAWHRTYGLPVLTTNSSNNYGPRQHPEKLIPLMILRALSDEDLPVYGDGRQVRDWLYVGDHCRALMRVLDAGRPGETYNIGGDCEKTNIELIRTLCTILDRLHPCADGSRHDARIRFVRDRPGHDRRYAIDSKKIRRELDWTPQENFEAGLEKTVRWYLAHPDWMRQIAGADYRRWIGRQYGAP